MADKIENHTLHLLREIRESQQTFQTEVRTFMEEQRAISTRLETKLDKQGIELVGVRGRVRKVEETLEAIARVMSEGILIDR